MARPCPEQERERDLIEAGLNEAALGTMGIVAKAFRRLTLSLGCGVRAESRLFARGTGDRGLCGAVALISGAGTVGIPDRRDRAGASIAVRRAETEHDH